MRIRSRSLVLVLPLLALSPARAELILFTPPVVQVTNEV